ncbi:FAD binding domain-containing protein [Streptomyces sp. NBC_00145]|uniref:FAD binding domain-containing protein n=1 Tax=Streptomyces sp. NBC_00145 TaxID=2975666 RepID=UPI002E18DA98
MKPPQFAYRDPHTIDEVLSLLGEAQDDAALLAGGQSLMPLLNMRLARPGLLIDLCRVEGLDTIEVRDDAVVTGATVRLAVLEHNEAVRGALPVLQRAAGFVAHPQIRNRTTVGGTLCHADPAAELPTVAVAVGARLHLRSQARSRVVDAEDFFESVFMTNRQPDEVLVSVEFPIHPRLRFTYDEVARRQGDFPFAGLCLGLAQDGDVVTDARAVAAGVGDRPMRLRSAEQALIGRPLHVGLEAAALAASQELTTSEGESGGADFKRGLLRALVRRLAQEFCEATHE